MAAKPTSSAYPQDYGEYIVNVARASRLLREINGWNGERCSVCCKCAVNSQSKECVEDIKNNSEKKIQQFN